MTELHRHEWVLAILYDGDVRALCQYPTCHAELNWVEIEEVLNEYEQETDELDWDDRDEASTEDLDWTDRTWIP